MMPTMTAFTHRPDFRTSADRSDFGMTCLQCGDVVIAPELVEFFSEERLVLSFWTCEKCGYQFDTVFFVPADAEPNVDNRVLEEDWSALS